MFDKRIFEIYQTPLSFPITITDSTTVIQFKNRYDALKSL